MEHSFNTEIAKEVGIASAVIFKHISFWVDKNEANKVHEAEGEYWTYNSIRAFTELFPYLTDWQIRTALKKLVDAGYIKEGCFNKAKYDRTIWYTLGERGKAFNLLQSQILEKTKMDIAKNQNGFAEKPKPIPYINTDTKTNNRGTANNRFIPPTVEEVDEYIKEKQFHFQANEFVDYYESKGWLVGKSKMKNWKAACRTFEANELKWHPELKDMPPTKNFTGEYGGHSYYEGERLD